MRIAYFGSPQISATLLESLLDVPQLSIEYVVSNVDSRKGRSGRLTPTPVVALAQERGLPVFRFEHPGRDGAAGVLAERPVDLFFVFAYGHILDARLLSLPERDAVNLHASLLPLLRGASPIQSALLQGFEETGWSLQLMSRRMDAGDVLARVTLKIDPDWNSDELTRALMPPGLRLVREVLLAYDRFRARAEPQDESRATYCKKIDATNGDIDWNQDAFAIHNQVRALNPWPMARSYIEGQQMIQILRTRHPGPGVDETRHSVGTLFGQKLEGSRRLYVRCGGGALEILELRPENRKALTGQSFLNGYLKAGAPLQLGPRAAR